MRCIHFSDVGVAVESMQDVEEIYLAYTALGIPFSKSFGEDCKDAQINLSGWYIQTTSGVITTNTREDELQISIVKYPITYLMDRWDFAVACQLLKSDQTEELIAHLAKHCKEFK